MASVELLVTTGLSVAQVTGVMANAEINNPSAQKACVRIVLWQRGRSVGGLVGVMVITRSFFQGLGSRFG